ncbi:hypothetical protein GCM10011534_38620 [Pseudooceanicola nanhaiensis]|uniref:Secreted protein n=1 Tax=Pseudooceanicola nanhaiensis TaxID=375761 RepID=A0A917T750_9RHOB|nr:hypothetical protein [Pseudooceanicola nanhaiensis]GGM12844.1 hypothetical protein GCM10011534_38620 [Pseudooceanicola nanhaiensis]
MKTTACALGILMLAAAPAAAAPTQEDSGASASAGTQDPAADVTRPPSDPETASSDADTKEDAATNVEDSYPSRDMLDDVQAVIDSVRSKTAMPQDPLSHLSSQGSVHVVPISDLEGNDAYHAQSLTEVLRENAEVIAGIRDQIRLNIFARRALESAGFTAEDILTWETAGTEDVTIIVDDR